MKKGRRVKPVFPIEYRLLLIQRYDERMKKHLTHAAIRTVNEFSSFRYEIIVTPSVDGNKVGFHIQGLRAPQVTIPHSGPAMFEHDFPGLNGTYDVVITKLDHAENRFTVDISRDEIVVRSSPQERFVDLVTDKEEF
ncbi:MAG TPA: hypothetical protein VLY03_07935 [Bacteroidota bacterium]|nr:hypothetical protein [Bacteroidota bacterium]